MIQKKITSEKMDSRNCKHRQKKNTKLEEMIWLMFVFYSVDKYLVAAIWHNNVALITLRM